jgi:cytochrome c
MKAVLLSAIVAASVLSAGVAQASADLAKDAGCTKCHDMDKKKKGAPGFKEVAAANKGKADAEAMLVKKITDPKGDHPEIKAKPDDAKAVVKWMLTL